MKKTIFFACMFILCLFVTSCGESYKYSDINTINTYNDIGNINQGALAAALDEYIFFYSTGVFYKMNIATGKVTFICNDPTCPHLGDCASQNKVKLQTSGSRLFAGGDIETQNGSTVVYSSFGEIAGGEYNKILEKNTLIYLPSVTKDRILSEIDNKIELIDINNGDIIKEYSFKYSLSLNELYCIDDTIYFVNGLGNLNTIDISTDEIRQISEEKVSCTIPYNEYIYYINAKDNTLCRMKCDGTDKYEVCKGCQTYNILGDVIYISKKTQNGIFTMDLNGANETQICDLENINSIYIFEKQQKLVCSSYENCYIGNLDGSGMKIPEVPKPLEGD